MATPEKEAYGRMSKTIREAGAHLKAFAEASVEFQKTWDRLFGGVQTMLAQHRMRERAGQTRDPTVVAALGRYTFRDMRETAHKRGVKKTRRKRK